MNRSKAGNGQSNNCATSSDCYLGERVLYERVFHRNDVRSTAEVRDDFQDVVFNSHGEVIAQTTINV